MSGKANAVFTIGLILIVLNFWISGQSTAVWKMFTGVPNLGSSGGSSGGGTTGGVNPNNPGAKGQPGTLGTGR